MKDMELQKRIENAVDTTLASLDPSVRQCSQIIREAMEGRKVKRFHITAKPLSVVLAIVLMLSCVGAAAAVLLSMRQAVEEEAIPMANATEGESYTAEDTVKLLQIAEDNGITISQDTIEKIDVALAQGEGYFKEEMLMAFSKAEFGDDPAAWTIEQQNWFDDVCVAVGFVSEKQKTMPEQGEDAKAPILDAAMAYVRGKYGSDLPLDDPNLYSVGVQYLNGNADGEYQGMYWSVAFIPKDLEGSEYWIDLNEQREVLGEHIMPGLQKQAGIRDVFNHYQTLYSWNPGWWSQEVMQSFQIRVLATRETWDKGYWVMERTVYPNIDANAISQEAAEDAALAYLHMTSAEYTKRVLRMGATYINASPNPVWKLLIQSPDNDWIVEVDAMTGEILHARRQPEEMEWYEYLVLDSTIEEVERTWVDQTPPQPEGVG